ncbi:MAG: DUF3667 domain-containing protein [Bacteroidales bacterium]|nr:DUF3667 domain-containing protein [Bacteroidales bacterium]
MKPFSRIHPRLRLWRIWCQLGYNPWHRPRKAKTKQKDSVYIGTREAIPFMNDDAKRTLSHLLLRPGYMMRDYILRGDHERYLAPFTALLVFYSVFTLIVAVVQPRMPQNSIAEDIIRETGEINVQVDSTHEHRRQALMSTLGTIREAFYLTRLDLHPEQVDSPWKASLAAVEDSLRGKGVPLFLGNFLLLWMSMAFLLRKREVSVSGAAAASAYILCQFCIFMFLALLFSFGSYSSLNTMVMGVLLFIDYRQMLGLKNRPAFWLTVKTGLVYLLIEVLFYVLLIAGLVIFALIRFNS